MRFDSRLVLGLLLGMLMGLHYGAVLTVYSPLLVIVALILVLRTIHH